MREMLLFTTVSLMVVNFVVSDSDGVLTKCPAIDPIDRTIHLPHEHDCTKFYKCSRGIKYVQDCPLYDNTHRLHYNPYLQVCDWPRNVQCWNARDECTQDEVPQSYPYDCSLYYECTDGARTIGKCGKGQLFDWRLKKCVPEAEANCNIYIDECPTDSSVGSVLLPHECKCSLYYECVRGEMVERRCAIGDNFDTNQRKCVPAENAVCLNGSSENIGVNCPASGIKPIPHTTDCSLYYMCINGVLHEKQCSDGLSFDESKGMCTWPPSSDCVSKAYKISLPKLNTTKEISTIPKCPPKGSKNGMFLPHHCSCTKYYACLGGDMVLEVCPDGMEYDYLRQVCDYPEIAVCKNRKSKYELFMSVRPQIVCPANVDDRFPHDDNCSLYYECQGGVIHLRSCMHGNYFNALLKTCDLPENTRCVNSENPDVTPLPNNECDVRDCDGIVRFPNVGNCSQYYQCEAGKKVQKQCPNRLQYDPVQQICDYPENVKCVPKVVCVTGEVTHHECQCNMYYECKDGRQVIRECPKGQSFDYKRKVCDNQENVICYNHETTNGCIGKCSSNNSTEKLAHENCQKHCECSGGVPKVIECPKYQFYNPEKGKCDWPENVPNLKCEPFPCDGDSEGIKLPHECHCDRYHVCINGTKHRKMCEDGKQFDYVQQACVDLGKAHCYVNQPVPETDDEKKCSRVCSPDENSNNNMSHKDCKKYCKCNNGRRKVYECEKGLFYNPDKMKCDFPENIKNLGCNPFPCPRDGKNIPLPHECNCSLYYVCSNGDKSRESCPKDEEFDYVKGTCVKAGTAHCYRKPSDKEFTDALSCI